MKPLLKQLYEGELCPCEKSDYFSQRHSQQHTAYYAQVEALYEKLKAFSPELAEELDALSLERVSLDAMALEDMFCYGFRLGLTLLAEALYP